MQSRKRVFFKISIDYKEQAEEMDYRDSFVVYFYPVVGIDFQKLNIR